MAYTISLKGTGFDREAWITDLRSVFPDQALAAGLPLSGLFHQWSALDEEPEEGHGWWIHAADGIRGVTIRKEPEGISLNVPAGNSLADFALAWELVRMGRKHGAEAGSDDHEVLPESGEELGEIARAVTAFHWQAILSSFPREEEVTIPVAGRIHLKIPKVGALLGASMLQAHFTEKMNLYSEAFPATLMDVAGDGVHRMVSVYSRIPTLMDSSTEQVHLAGDCLKPGNKDLLAIDAEVFYQCFGGKAEPLGPCHYVPAASDAVLEALINAAREKSSREKRDWLKRDIPAPVSPATFRLREKPSMAPEDWGTLAKAPCLVFLMVAAVDGKIDKKEILSFGQILTDEAESPSPVVGKILEITRGHLMEIIEFLLRGNSNPAEDLIEIATLLRSGKLPPGESRIVADFLCDLGKTIASSSGGFFGFGSKIGKKEAKILLALKGILIA